MAISDEDRASLADLAMQALDTIIDDYGEDATLTAASLVFEVRTAGDGNTPAFHTNYCSLPHNSTNHIAGILHGTATWLWTPDETED